MGMNVKKIYLQVEKHQADMLRSDVKYWIKRCCEKDKHLQSYKQKEDKLREYIESKSIERKIKHDLYYEIFNEFVGTKEELLQILNEGGKECL